MDYPCGPTSPDYPKHYVEGQVFYSDQTNAVQAIEIEFSADLDIQPLIANEQQLEIIDEASAKNAVSMALQARKLKNDLEETRKRIVKPSLDYQRSVMEFCKRFTSKLQEIEESLQKKLGHWVEEQEESPFTRVDEIATEDGKLSVKKVFYCEVIDRELIPREYMIPDEKAIQRSVDNGIRHIPGIGIYTKKEISMRVKN